MTEIASKAQLRMSYLRWALITVPGLVFLGFLSSRIADGGYGNPWFDALAKPAIMPPGLVFPIAWTILYTMQGFALALILDARRARRREMAIALFAVQFIANLIWSPLFFAAHQVVAAFATILFMLAFAIATTIMFGKIRHAAAWLMLPYLVWLGFASVLNWQIHALNPNAETLAPVRPGTQIDIS